MNDRTTAIAAYAAKLREHREEIVALLIQETGKVNGNAEYDFDMLPNCKYAILWGKVLHLPRKVDTRTALPCVRHRHAPKLHATQ